jgi:enoyl-[acyl-carrier protein] reductase I
MNSLLVVAALALLVDSTLAFRLSSSWMQRSSSVAGVKSSLGASRDMTMSSGLKINLQGKKIFVAGVADASGYGWAIAKACAEAGATILLGTWPPVLPLFAKGMERGQFDEEMTLSDGSKMNIAKIYPLDATFDDAASIPESVSESKRYKAYKNFSLSEVATLVKQEFGELDGVVHALANGPEVTKPLLQTSRNGYLAAVSSSAYSLVSLVQHFAPLLSTERGGAFVSLSYLASERVVAGYGGGMSSAKAALESDTRTLSYELGRLFNKDVPDKGIIRINCISAGPLASRAATAIGGASKAPAGEAPVDKRTFIEKAIDYSTHNAPQSRTLTAKDVGCTAAFLLSDLAMGITGNTVYVDNGLSHMGLALDSHSLTTPPAQ